MLASQTAAQVAQALGRNNFSAVQDEVDKLRVQARKVQNKQLDRSIAAFLKAFDNSDSQKTSSTFSAVFKACGSLG